MPATNPLDQLKDIHLPEAVGFWPLAPGWWLLAAGLIGITVIAALFFRHYKKRAYRRIAVRQLNMLFADYQQHQHGHDLSAAINRLLKKVALQAYARPEVSRLTQNQWLAFLDDSAKMQSFEQGPGRILASAPYTASCEVADVATLQRCCITWIRRHQ